MNDFTLEQREMIEEARMNWAEIARENDWYHEPFGLHIWVDTNNNIIDILAHKDLKQDIVERENNNNADD